MSTRYYENLSPAYLGHYCRRLSNVIVEQSSEILNEMGIVTPSASISAITYLHMNSPISVANLAEALGVSHQMATQRVNQLEKLGLIQRIHLEGDKRVKQVILTPLAKSEVKRLKPFTKKVDSIFLELEKELNCQLMSGLRKAELSLLDKPLSQRVKTRGKN